MKIFSDIQKEKAYLINSYLLMLFGFVLPISVAIANIIMVIIILNWLLIGDFKNNFNELKNNRVVLAILLFLSLHFIGLLWTNDIEWGLHILKKELKFLLLPIFMIFVRKEHIKYYILTFLAAISISEILSYFVWFEIIGAFKNATVHNPTPFMSHISYNPFLTIAIYITAYYLLFESKKYNNKFIYIFFILTMSINMFITGGRAGQIMYFTMIIILFFQYYNKSIIRALVGSVVTLSLIIFTAYNTSKIFYDRVNLAYHEVSDYENKKNSSVGLRFTFAINSFEIIKKNAIVGVGTGDFKEEYAKVNKINTPNLPDTTNPHNMYTLVLVQFGILGLASLLLILYSQIKFAYKSKDKLVHKLGLALPLLFSVIMFSDSYLLGHFTTMLFIYFSAILYKDWEYERT